MKKLYTKSLLALLIIFSFSCEDINEDINSNPNDILITDVEDKLFLTGAQLANIQLQLGHLNRISGMYSGQLIGFSSLYANIYGMALSTVESNGSWNALYVGVLTNMRQLQNNSSNTLLVGIAEVMEGHAFGTAASLWGGIPYSEAGNPEISDPIFDSQVSVYNAAIQKLNSGISTLQSASSTSLSQDIIFGGDKDKWIEAAYTLIARFNLHKKDYGAAIAAASATFMRLECGMCNFSSGPCALFPGPDEPVQRKQAFGYLFCIIAMKGIVPPIQVDIGGFPVR